MNRILQQITTQPLSIEMPSGETKIISFEQDVIDTLSKESWRIDDLIGLVENLRHAREARQEAEKTGNTKIIEKTTQYYQYIVNKISVLNSASPESRYAKELILWTEPYRYLSNHTIEDLIIYHLRPLLLQTERRQAKALQFIEAFSKKVKKDLNQLWDINEERIKLSSHAYVLPEELFVEGSTDGGALIKLMEEIHNSSYSHPDIDLMEEKEFVMYCMTMHPFFTFDLQKAIDHKSSANYPLFYIGEDRAKATSQRKID